MSHIKTQISGIRYNAADARFEALVTFHGPFGQTSVPAFSHAPIDADFDTLSDEFLRDALTRLTAPSALRMIRTQTAIQTPSTQDYPHAA
ncbi:MAG: hypothetical protein N4A61_12380 [Pelagimonas sp.]|jgi:hypothetical protein|nr:hypothetical protein [Pelagimonas sp.]